MTINFCSGGTGRGRWAVGLCFASTVIMSLEALHPNACAWLGMNPEESYAISAILATASAFMAAFILTQLVTAPANGRNV
jgi:hypothetical protein